MDLLMDSIIRLTRQTTAPAGTRELINKRNLERKASEKRVFSIMIPAGTYQVLSVQASWGWLFFMYQVRTGKRIVILHVRY
jgi:hypothetical protein